jgi:hypothetical protein
MHRDLLRSRATSSVEMLVVMGVLMGSPRSIFLEMRETSVHARMLGVATYGREIVLKLLPT